MPHDEDSTRARLRGWLSTLVTVVVIVVLVVLLVAGVISGAKDMTP